MRTNLNLLDVCIEIDGDIIREEGGEVLPNLPDPDLAYSPEEIFATFYGYGQEGRIVTEIHSIAAIMNSLAIGKTEPHQLEAFINALEKAAEYIEAPANPEEVMSLLFE